MIVADINRRYVTSYQASDIEVNIVRETMVNETDIVTNAKLEAETKAIIIQTILAAAPRIDEESVLKLICEQFDLDWEEVQKLIEEQEFTSGLQDDTDPVEGELNAQVAEVSKTLNGAQITSMMAIVEKVTAGTLSADQGIAILTGSLGIDLAQAQKVIGVAEEVAASGTA